MTGDRRPATDDSAIATVHGRRSSRREVMAKDKAAQMEEIATAIRDLEESPLYDFRQENDYSAVIGEGDVDADIMIIGEAPGEQEAQSGRPFVGNAGNVLDALTDDCQCSSMNFSNP